MAFHPGESTAPSHHMMPEPCVEIGHSFAQRRLFSEVDLPAKAVVVIHDGAHEVMSRWLLKKTAAIGIESFSFAPFVLSQQVQAASQGTEVVLGTSPYTYLIKKLARKLRVAESGHAEKVPCIGLRGEAVLESRRTEPLLALRGPLFNNIGDMIRIVQALAATGNHHVCIGQDTGPSKELPVVRPESGDSREIRLGIQPTEDQLRYGAHNEAPQLGFA